MFGGFRAKVKTLKSMGKPGSSARQAGYDKCVKLWDSRSPSKEGLDDEKAMFLSKQLCKSQAPSSLGPASLKPT